jgi:phosphatidate cytidylyltransferase
MLKTRLLVSYLIIPIVAGAIALGGWVLNISVALAVGIASWEYCQMFRSGGYSPSALTLVVGAPLLVLAQAIFGFPGRVFLLTLLVLLSMAAHVVTYQQGNEHAGLDFGITIGGLLCIGWLGSYLIPLRSLPDGLWWSLLVIPSAAVSDGGAYLVGKRFGKHKIADRVSPKKSWEGLLGGILFAAIFIPGFAALWHLKAPAITPEKGLVLGLILGAVPTIGDLGISMFKRQFNLKNTGNLLPGHGGILDRIDSWLWATSIGYYLVTLLW